jgi:tRNA(Leu) C34 or U34 (ribose-2'-O)-methylase TrmL
MSKKNSLNENKNPQEEAPLFGVTPAIVLIKPKFPNNLASIIRAASAFGVHQVWYTGNRIQMKEGDRVPREFRCKEYKNVELIKNDYPLKHFENYTPVAVELLNNSESLPYFEHPVNPIYIFGPEDGSIPQVMRCLCHKFIHIPTAHCINLAGAVYITLYDRILKQMGV